MSISTFAELKAAVETRTVRTDFPDDVYTLAQAELYSRLRLREMESTSSLTVNAEEENLPADFLEARHLYVDRTPRLVIEIVDEFAKDADFQSSGVPATATILGTKVRFNPVPDGSYTVLLRYIAKPATFSADSDTNTILTNYPSLFLYASLKHFSAWAMRPEDGAVYDAMLESELGRVQAQDKRSRYGGGPLRSRALATP